jgi:hypothetical protein
VRSSLLLILHVTVLVSALGCRKAHVEVRPDDKQSGPPRVTCKLPEPIGTATVPARCDLAIDKLVSVHAGESLTIEAGAKLTFGKGTGLVLDGGTLRARGTKEEPVVLTSATRAPGEWTGIVFTHRPFALSPKLAAKTDAGPDAAAIPPNSESVLEHIVVEYGGARAEAVPPYYKETAGIYVMPLVGDTVALSNVKLRNNAGHALWIDGAHSVTKVEAIDFDTARVRLPIEQVAAIGDNLVGTVVLSGSTDKSVVLGKRAYVFENVSARGMTTPVTFEIEKGSTIKLAKRGHFSIDGHSVGAKLIAHEVLFTSNEAAPAAGDWDEISFTGDSSADIDACTFEFAGSSRKSSAGVIRIRARDEKKLRIVNSTFRDNVGAAFDAMEDCKPWEDPALKNKSTTKLCEESPLFKSMKLSAASMAGLLGSLGTKSSISGAFGSGGLGKIAPLDDDLKGYGSGYLGGPGGMGGGGSSIGIGGLGTPKSTAKVVESSVTATGALPADVVRKAVRARIGSLRSCHSSGNGTITVSFAIDDKGSVTSAKASGGTLTDTTTRSCVEGVFRGMSFPAPDGGGTTNATATHDYSN